MEFVRTSAPEALATVSGRAPMPAVSETKIGAGLPAPPVAAVSPAAVTPAGPAATLPVTAAPAAGLPPTAPSAAMLPAVVLTAVVLPACGRLLLFAGGGRSEAAASVS